MQDIQLISEIVKNTDTVVDAGLTKRGEQGIKYSKKMLDRTIFFVEEVRTGKKELAFTTMYKKQIAQK